MGVGFTIVSLSNNLSCVALDALPDSWWTSLRERLLFGVFLISSVFSLVFGLKRRNQSIRNRIQQSDPSDQNQEGFEVARMAQEKELKEKELAVEVARMAQEGELKKKELDLQRDQLRWNRLSNPALAAIVAGLIGYIGTLISTYATRLVEDNRQIALEKLEQEKQEGTLILEAIKTPGTGDDKDKRTAANLVLLVDAGLITKIKPPELDRLREKAQGTVAGLAAAGSVEFKPSSTLTKGLQTKLKKALDLYENYLETIGYERPPNDERISIRVDEDVQAGAYYSDNTKEVVLGINLAGDPEYALSEYTWYVLKVSNSRAFTAIASTAPGNFSNSIHFKGFAYGVKVYLAASFLDDPRVGKSFYSLIGLSPSIPIGDGFGISEPGNEKETGVPSKGVSQPGESCR